MGTPPKPIRAKTAKKTAIKDPGLPYYSPALRDVVSRSDVVQMKALLKTAKDLQKTDIAKVIANLEAAIAKAGK